ncbi:MAG: hypothetical protein IPN84_14605 [Sphingomonadales bacterium]|nr:hypothetical protein [Sphingomonadales bacterium]
MSRLSPAFVLGYHGCDAEVAQRAIGGGSLKPSENDYDWLGSGVYFWEADPDRAWQWAYEQNSRGKIEKPAILGAVIDLRNCLNLTTQEGVSLLRKAYESYKAFREIEGKPLHVNSDLARIPSSDKLMRRLDNAVIERLHGLVKDNNLEPFDTVRGMFREGEAIYPNAGFWEKTHVQIAVRNHDCIIGYFKPKLKLLLIK